MKKDIAKIISVYNTQINLARANKFEAVMIPLSCEYDLYCLDSHNDMEYIYEVALESGWDEFVLMDFVKNKTKVIDLYELDAA